MPRPKPTRLRFVSAKKPEVITEWLMGMQRVQIYGSPTFVDGRWYLWFVPNDDGADIPNTKL